MRTSTLFAVTSIFSICLLISTSCGPKKITPQSQLHDKVMEVHDEVMPKMKDIHQLKKKLKNKAKEDIPQDVADKIKMANESLERADDAMMDWMADYDKPKEGAEGAMKYLQDQMTKIESVRAEMLAAIGNAQNLLNAN